MDARSDALAGLRILVVEDEMLVAMLIEQMLQELRCDVIGPVSTVEDAIAAVRTQRLDGALLDMNLHGKSSSLAADELLDRAVPFLLVTGYVSSDRDLAVLKTAPRLKKPFDMDDLRDRMLEVFVGQPGSQ
jgi:DNA-binding response OmpR family regulator